jgi:hypothetical protein
MNVYSMLVILGVYSLFAWVILTLLANRRLTNAARIQAELQTRLLAYLESPAGQRLAQAVTLERGNPYRRILGSVQTGLILTVVGGALLALRGQLGAEDVHGLTFVGAIGMSLGIGFLASAYMAYRLSKAWGLLGTPGECAGATDRA